MVGKEEALTPVMSAYSWPEIRKRKALNRLMSGPANQ